MAPRLWNLRCNTRIAAAMSLLLAGALERGAAQPATFAGDAQHTGLSSPLAQHLNVIRWSTVIDPYTSGAGAHYGAPVISPSNTLFVPVTTSNGGFKVSAFEGATGRLKY